MREVDDSIVTRAAYLEAICHAVPYHVVERVLRAPRVDLMTPQRERGVVLSLDLAGFSRMTEALFKKGDGLQAISQLLIQRIGGIMEEAIFPFGGYVVHFGGDAITAFFTGDAAAPRAAAAALRCHHHLGVHGRNLQARVGLAHGEIVLLTVGDVTQCASICTGETAHRAVALQKAAPTRGTVIDADMRTALGENAQVKPHEGASFVLEGLRDEPAQLAVPSLAGRLESDTEDKIVALEPYIPAPLLAQLKMSPTFSWRTSDVRPAVIVFTEFRHGDEHDLAAFTQVLSRSVVRTYRKHGGTIMKVDLDAECHRMLALFGLHRPKANDPERAVLAALEAAERVRALAESYGRNFWVQTGVHLGRVFFGAIGTEKKHDITVIGSPVNTCARATAAADKFAVVATGPLVQALESSFHTRSLGEFRLKGLRGAFELFVVKEPASHASRYVRPRRHVRPLFGRESERRKIDKLVASAAAGDGGMVLIEGEAGLGKSATLSDFIEPWLARGGLALIGRCHYSTKHLPLASTIDKFMRFLGITEGATPAERIQKIRNGLRGYDLGEGGAELMALLDPVVHADGRSERSVDLEDADARHRIVAAVIRFVRQRMRERALLYIIEDMHYADPLTLQLVDTLAETKLEGEFLFIATSQPQPMIERLRRAARHHFVLSPLDLTAVERLTAFRTGAKRTDPELAQFLFQRSQGNPGHLVEMLYFIERHALVERRAGVVVPRAQALSELQQLVPSNLARAIVSEMDELTALERSVLRLGSIYERPFARDELLALDDKGLGADIVEASLAALSGRGFLQSSGAGYVFRDDLLRSVALAAISPERRKTLQEKMPR